MNIQELQVINDADLKISKNKLKNSLISLRSAIDNELRIIEQENNDYSPSSKLGIIQGEGNVIDNLIGKISVLSSNKDKLKLLIKKEY